MSIIRTVLGDIPPEELGITLCHEHLLIDLKRIFREPEDPMQREMSYQPVRMENLGWVRTNYAKSWDNLGLYEERVTADELMLFKMEGGTSLVEVTPVDIGRNPEGLARISAATGVNVVMGCGYYIDDTHPDELRQRPEDQICGELVADVNEGVTPGGVKAGIIGEIGCSWPLTDNERKVLRAAARAQSETGAALTIHPGRDPEAPHEILDVIEEAGGSVERTVMGHLDRTYSDPETLSRFAARGCYLEFDMFGLESAYYPFGPADLPNDGRRIDYIIGLIGQGLLDKILISHDIAFKHALTRYGGLGYRHILQNVMPKMKTKGMSQDEVDTILITNPRRMLALN